MATLLIQDIEDGTGVTATMSGTGGQSSTVYYLRNSGNDTSFTWTEGATIIGDSSGAVSISTVGTYWFYALTGTAVSNFVQSPVTDGTKPTFERILLGVQSRIRDIGLSGVASDSVLVVKFPWDRNPIEERNLPYILISPSREQFNARDREGSNYMDRIGYTVLVVSVASSNQALTSQTTTLDRRHRIFKAFRNHWWLSGVPEILSIEVQPGDVYVPSAFSQNMDASALMLRCFTRETRGI